MWENSNIFFEEAFGNIFQILFHMYIFEKLMEMCIYWLNRDDEFSLICNSKYLEAICVPIHKGWVNTCIYISWNIYHVAVKLS